MRKKFGLVITITLAIVFGLGISGCSKKSIQTAEPSYYDYEDVNQVVSDEETTPDDMGLIVISYTSDEVDSYIMYDPETYVMYVFVRDGRTAASVGGLTVMLNPDGTPRLYDPQD